MGEENRSSRRNILVAEDETDLRQVLVLALGQCYEVQAVEDGLAAVRALAAISRSVETGEWVNIADVTGGV